MKQLIVLIATVILGIGLSGTVLGMGGNVDAIAKSTGSKIEQELHYTSEGGINLDAALNRTNN